MKTAMQELIELLELNTTNEPLPHLIDVIKEVYIQKEKEQIINAYNYNMTGFDKLEQEEIGLNWAEDYYNQTYNQNK